MKIGPHNLELQNFSPPVGALRPGGPSASMVFFFARDFFLPEIFFISGKDLGQKIISGKILPEIFR